MKFVVLFALLAIIAAAFAVPAPQLDDGGELLDGEILDNLDVGDDI